MAIADASITAPYMAPLSIDNKRGTGSQETMITEGTSQHLWSSRTHTTIIKTLPTLLHAKSDVIAHRKCRVR